MPCFRPLTGYRSNHVNPTGKRSIVFSIREAQDVDSPLTIPCGQCRYCRLEHSRQWALRAFHEASLHERNCFITLTYNPENLPKNGSLDYEAPVLFMKRLRKKYGDNIRSFGCAEYGEKLHRPHYHLCLFNIDFEDKVQIKNTHDHNNDTPLYMSKDLSELWPYGFSSIGNLTFESAAYVARYVTKKITGDNAEKHYSHADPSTGEIHTKLPERSICVSRNPGLGKKWYENYKDFVLNNDFVVLRSKRMRPPKYYDRLADKSDPEKHSETKAKRALAGKKASRILDLEDAKNYANFDWSKDGPTPKQRLHVMEDVQELKFQQLKRNLEK